MRLLFFRPSLLYITTTIHHDTSGKDLFPWSWSADALQCRSSRLILPVERCLFQLLLLVEVGEMRVCKAVNQNPPCSPWELSLRLVPWSSSCIQSQYEFCKSSILLLVELHFPASLCRALSVPTGSLRSSLRTHSRNFIASEVRRLYLAARSPMVQWQ